MRILPRNTGQKIRNTLAYLRWWRKLKGPKKIFAQVITLCFVIFLGILAFTELSTPKGAAAEWFNENWAYRKVISITAHTSSENNVYVNVGATTYVKTGTYTGNGTSKSITGLGFQPTFVLIKNGSNTNSAVATTDTMGANNTKPLTGNTATGTGMVTSLDSDGFSVGSDATVNTNTNTYYYIAIRDASGQKFKTFSYTGTGSQHNESQCGFAPNLVIIMSAGANAAVFRTSTYPANTSNLFNGSSATNRLLDFTADGFGVSTSSTVNTSSTVYYGICAKEATNLFDVTSYTGNGSDNRNISGVGFQPDFTLTKKEDTSDTAAVRFKDNVGDSAPTMNSANAADQIQSFTSDGFQVGTNICCNTNAATYHSFSFQEGIGSTVTIDTSDTTRFQSDCGDIRFTDANGKLLKYYLVSGCGTANTVFEVALGSFPSGAQALYMYYGNPSAANGFSSSYFTTEASGYTIGSLGSEENGPAPVLSYKFDEGGGTQASSSGSLRVSAGLYNNPTWKDSTQCLYQNCLQFDGTDDYLQALDPFYSNSLSLSAWINPTAYAGTDHKVIISKRGSGATNIEYMLSMTTTGTIQFNGWNSAGTNFLQVTTTSIVPLNQWTHLEATYNGSTANIYINGILAVTGAASGTLNDTSNPITIGSCANSSGGCTNGSTRYFKGFIDEVRIYNYYRSASQVLTDYVSRGANSGSGIVLGAKDTSYLSNGLVGYWKMDETSANTCSGGVKDNCDSSPIANDGTWNGNTTASSSAKFGAGATFDGTASTYTSVGSVTSYDFNTNFTVSTWVLLKSKPSSGSTVKMVYKDYTSSPFETFEIGFDGDNGFFFEVPNSDASKYGYTYSYPASQFSTNTWYLVTGVKEGTSLKLYVNGALYNTDTLPGNMATSTNSLYFGGLPGGNRMNGVLDEMRLYNRAFSSQEVEQLYNYAPGPVGYWKFDEKTGTTTSDDSGYGNNGTLTSSPAWTRGKYGGGINFDNNSGYVSVTDNATLKPKSFTAEAWVYTTASSQQIFYKGTGFHAQASQNAIELYYVGSSKQWELRVNDGTTETPALSTNATDKSLGWHHIAGTVQEGGDISLYVDGVLLRSTRNLSTGTITSANPLLIGANQSNNVDSAGKVDEVKFYNYVRSPKQIVEDMNASHPAGGSPVGSYLGHWDFDRGSGDVASNSGVIGSAANGKMYNFSSPPSQISGWSNDGRFGRALNFDKSDDVVEMGSDSSIDDMASLSVSGWFNPRSTGEGTSGTLFDKSNSGSGTNGWQAYLTGGTSIFFNVDYSGVDLQVVTNQAISLNNWSHVMITWDGTATASHVHIYINGKEVSYSTQIDGTGSRVTDASSQFRVGNTVNRAFTWDGWIDDVKLYNYVLSYSDVKVDYNRGQSVQWGGLGINPSDGKSASGSANASYCVPGDTTTLSCAPAGEWRFEEKQGSITADTSGNNQNGTLISSPQWTSGKVGSALKFNGSSSYVSATPTRTTGDKMSTSGWFSFDGDSNVNQVDKYNPLWGMHSEFALVMRSGSIGVNAYFIRLQATTANGGTNNIDMPAALSTRLRGWHHVAATYDGTYASIYLDAKLLQRTAVSDTGIKNNGQPFEIGADTLSGYYTDTKVDEVRFYRYALTPAQIAWDYNKGKPVGYYDFDECQGSILHEYYNNSVLNQSITIGGSGTTSVGSCGTSSTAWGGSSGIGKYNYALTLDGTDDYASTSATVINTVGQGSYNTVSWGGWFNPATSVASKILIEKNREFRLTTDASSQPNCSIWNAGNWVTAGVSNKALSLGSWAHVVCVYDGSTLKVYVNGNLTGSTSQSNTITSLSYTVLSTGRDFGGTAFYKGQIDDEVIFNYPLTPIQILTLYNGGAVRFGPSTGAP